MVITPKSGKPRLDDNAPPDKYNASKPASLAKSAAKALCAPGTRTISEPEYSFSSFPPGVKGLFGCVNQVI